MKVVIDCNVIVSAARVGGTCGRVVVEALLGHEIVLSKPILDEYREIAHRPKQAQYRGVLLAIIDEIERVATSIEPENITFGLNDPDDEIYLATAVIPSSVNKDL